MKPRRRRRTAPEREKKIAGDEGDRRRPWLPPERWRMQLWSSLCLNERGKGTARVCSGGICREEEEEGERRGSLSL